MEDKLGYVGESMAILRSVKMCIRVHLVERIRERRTYVIAIHLCCQRTRAGSLRVA